MKGIMVAMGPLKWLNLISNVPVKRLKRQLSTISSFASCHIFCLVAT